METTVRKASLHDSAAIAAIHQAAFVRQRDSAAWVSATLAAEPRFYAYVVEAGTAILGYIFWAQKSGIRQEVVLELDQVAVHPTHQGQGHAEQLMRASLPLVQGELARCGQYLKAVWVSTRADNPAQRLYTRVLGVREVAHIDGLYTAREVILLTPTSPP